MHIQWCHLVDLMSNIPFLAPPEYINYRAIHMGTARCTFLSRALVIFNIVNSEPQGQKQNKSMSIVCYNVNFFYCLGKMHIQHFSFARPMARQIGSKPLLIHIKKCCVLSFQNCLANIMKLQLHRNCEFLLTLTSLWLDAVFFMDHREFQVSLSAQLMVCMLASCNKGAITPLQTCFPTRFYQVDPT